MRRGKSAVFFSRLLALLAAGTLSFQAGADPVKPADGRIDTIIEAVREKHAPDPLTSLFEVSHEEKNGRIIVTGLSDSIEAIAELKAAMQNARLPVEDRLKRVPRTDDLEDRIWAVATAPGIVTIDGGDRVSVGTPMMRFATDGKTSLVRLPNGRVTRLSEDSIRPMTETDIFIWNRREKIVITAENTLFTPLSKDEEPILLPQGSRLRFDAETNTAYAAALPDGKRGTVDKSSAAKVAPFQENREIKRRERRSVFLREMNLQAVKLRGRLHNSRDFIRALFASQDLIILSDPDYLLRAFPHVRTEHNGSGLKIGDLLIFEKRSGEKTMAWSAGNGKFVTPALKRTTALGSAEAAAIGHLVAAVRPDYGFLNDPCLTSTLSNPYYQTPAAPLVPCRKRSSIEAVR